MEAKESAPRSRWLTLCNVALYSPHFADSTETKPSFLPVHRKRKLGGASVAWPGNISPLVVTTKSDCAGVEGRGRTAEAYLPGS